MFEIECPKCEQKVNVENEELPNHAIDSFEIECGNCGHKFKAGWYAELELRD